MIFIKQCIIFGGKDGPYKMPDYCHHYLHGLEESELNRRWAQLTPSQRGEVVMAVMHGSMYSDEFKNCDVTEIDAIVNYHLYEGALYKFSYDDFQIILDYLSGTREIKDGLMVSCG